MSVEVGFERLKTPIIPRLLFASWSPLEMRALSQLLAVMRSSP